MRPVFYRLAGLFLAIATKAAAAQTTYSNEFWPEIDLHHRFADQTELIGLLDTSRDRDSGSAYQGELGAVLDHRFVDWFSARIGYRHGQALDGGPFREDRLLSEQTFRLILAPRWLADFRTREDFRWLNTGYSMRFRERGLVQREMTIADYTFQPYASAEIYFDTRYDQFARYRLIAGSTFPLAKHFLLEPYYAHQVDFAGSSAVVDALSLVLHVSF